MCFKHGEIIDGLLSEWIKLRKHVSLISYDFPFPLLISLYIIDLNTVLVDEVIEWRRNYLMNLKHHISNCRANIGGILFIAFLDLGNNEMIPYNAYTCKQLQSPELIYLCPWEHKQTQIESAITTLSWYESKHIKWEPLF